MGSPAQAGATTGFAAALGALGGALAGYFVNATVGTDRQDRAAIVEGAALAGGLIGAFWGGVIVASASPDASAAKALTP